MGRETQRKGDIATTQAIATFTKLGYDVSIPITESAKYDLVVDDGNKLHRVQVKFTKNKTVDLRMVHSNSKGYVVKKTQENEYDWLYILFCNEEGYTEHLLKECLVGRAGINVTVNNLLGS